MLRRGIVLVALISLRDCEVHSLFFFFAFQFRKAKWEREKKKTFRKRVGQLNNEKFQAVFKCFIGFLIMFAHQRGPPQRCHRA